MTYENFLKEYIDKGLLKRQKSDFRAIEKLMQRAHRDLMTAKVNLDIDEGIAYTVAYLAMLHAARAFMLFKGFRPTDGFQHKTVVEFMAQYLIKENRTIVEYFDRMRRKRNVFTYEVSISISKTEADNALNMAVKFVNLVKDIMGKENPQFEFKFK